MATAGTGKPEEKAEGEAKKKGRARRVGEYVLSSIWEEAVRPALNFMFTTKKGLLLTGAAVIDQVYMGGQTASMLVNAFTAVAAATNPLVAAGLFVAGTFAAYKLLQNVGNTNPFSVTGALKLAFIVGGIALGASMLADPLVASKLLSAPGYNPFGL